MSLDAFIMLIGAIIAALPFSGFPHAWLQWIMFGFGVLVFALGTVVRRKMSKKMRQQEIPFDAIDQA